MKGLVFDIQHFSIYDGPGIRTTVFMKGCSLDCAWCHNPESISLAKEVQTYFFKCIGCGKCFEVCPEGAHKITENGRHYERELCINCGACVENCYSGTLVMSGERMSVDHIITEVSKDIPFYKDSGGGVTFSGGEPLLQSDFIMKALIKLKEKNIHTAVDTAGNVPYSAIQKVIPYTDLFLYDVKAFNNDKHKEFTGAGNKLILENLKKISESGISARIRIPVIPGVNDDLKEIDCIADFLCKLKNIEAVEPLAYHSLGAGKLESMGKVGERSVFEVPSKDMMNRIYRLIEEKGLKVIKKSS